MFEDKYKLIEQELIKVKKNLEVNLDKLPKEDLPFIEPHLVALYFQTYFLTAHGFHNPGLIMCGVLLEALVKQRLYESGISDNKIEKMDFGKAITECEKMKILGKEEIEFLRNKKDKLRNPYLHYNQIKLTEKIQVPLGQIPLDKLKEFILKVSKGELTEQEARNQIFKNSNPKLKSSKEFRPLGQVIKSQIDEEIAIPTFLEIDNFLRSFCKKYFNYANK